MSSPPEKCSVVILGSTQAGKSTLIEHIRSYADPDYAIDESLLGTGIVSKTDNPTLILLNSSLPAYEVFRKDTGEIFDLKKLATQDGDEEDYRDILLSHPDEVDIRLAPQDPNEPSESIEFQFLDTPGLNGTQGRDSEHVTNIVKEVISTRSFNLIVFVISSQNPLTEEKQLALEYFAYVLRGLHSRIVFLHTHVDYSETHISNTTHHFDMKLKNNFLSKIFRRHSGEGIYDEENIETYPNFMIDLVTRKRPLVQCLIRNTIREILMMAAASVPPAILDTSTWNIERIRAITYPIEFNEEQRKELQAKLREESQRELDSRQSLIQNEPRYSVLVIGKTQSGKSALIEHIKNYADPNYTIDRSLLGHGNFSKTDTTRPISVKTNLPKYEVFCKEPEYVIDLHEISNEYEEEYQNILSFRDFSAGMRLASQDPNTSPENVEFRFLDTPGLNNTSNGDSNISHRDSNNAVNIISEIINTRSFNLIIIVVPFTGALTSEQVFSLEYFADVLRGLHSRIIFLHTYVDYCQIHPSNIEYQDKLLDRNRKLRRIFRRYDWDPMIGHSNTREYPSFTIDLVSRKRPIINGLIRNTIREILKLATRPPVVLDTSIQNIERIRAIAHPSKFSAEERIMFRSHFITEAEAERLERLFMEEQLRRPAEEDQLRRPTAEERVSVRDESLDQINILLIGDVQSGKTSLVETFKVYADPNYTPETVHATQSISRSADEDVMITSFRTDLHIVQIRKLKGSTDDYDVVDFDEQAKRLSKEDFQGLLRLGPEGVETVIIASSSVRKYQFNVYEGPSLNESAKNFERNIFNIYKSLVESKARFHQVLITLAPGPITSTVQTTIRICSDVFSGISSLFTFVHTKIDYSELHISNKRFQDSMRERQELLQLTIESKATSYLIDCNFQSDCPVQHAKTQNVVQNILKDATSQTPIVLKSPLMKKTPKMVRIDTSLKCQSRRNFQFSERDIFENNNYITDIRSQIRRSYAEYKDMDVTFCNDDLEVLFESDYLAQAEINPKMSWRTMAFGEQPRTIERVDLQNSNIEFKQVLGGEGFNHLRITYRRMSSDASFLCVGLFARRQNCHSNPVGETSDMASNRRKREKLESRLLDAEKIAHALNDEHQKEYHLPRYCILRETLPMAVMEELILARVYETDETDDIDLTVYSKIMNIYMGSEGALGSDPYEGIENPGPANGDENVYSVDSGHPVDKYSVLIFGKTQAGKSTFIEFVKNYANQEYNINKGLIGNGFQSKTSKPAQFAIKSSLPSYEVLDRSNNLVDIDNLASKSNDAEDYLDALNNRKVTVQPVVEIPDAPPSRHVKITFLDTPGIEDTNGKDIEHAPRIVHEMAKMRTFNLIIIFVNVEDHPSMSQQLAFDYYSKVIQILQGSHSNIVFVYTHVDYNKCHPSNVDFNNNILLRHKAFSRLFRGYEHKAKQGGGFSHAETVADEVDLYPWFTIDLDKKHRPIPRCMLLRKLREILQLAVESRPVPLDTIIGNLLRVYGINHPDELNKEQRSMIVDPMRMILEQRGECSDAPVAVSDGVKTERNNFKGAAEEDKTADQPVDNPEDCDIYFP
ncbi:hypothetical protein CPB97_001780 [Podila verticillata]|nr:hypothetical protein CPB97_001780 [Podila verticillata]